MNTNRRNFLTNMLATTAGLATIPNILAASLPTVNRKKQSGDITLRKNSVILFQGDSITDASRDKTNEIANSAKSFGNGYAFLVASGILNKYASHELTIYNRGISGNKIYQLTERWQKDCFDLQPHILSILIGVNDFWHTINGKYDGTVEKYETGYRQLLNMTTKMLPDVQLIIGEPFAILGCSTVTEKWFPEFDLYRASAEKLADEFGAIFIPYQAIFTEAQKYAPASYWTPDGVHPSMAGCSLMAEAWLKSAL